METKLKSFCSFTGLFAVFLFLEAALVWTVYKEYQLGNFWRSAVFIALAAIAAFSIIRAYLRDKKNPRKR